MKRALFKKNANMTYVVHIIKMNNCRISQVEDDGL